MKNAFTILGIIIVIVLLCLAYYVGVRHAMAPTSTATSTVSMQMGSSTPNSSPSSTSTAYYEDTSSWQVSRENQAGFSIKYPIDFPITENNTMTQSTDWRLNSTDPGVKVLTITVPSAFEPQTNFADATLTVGYSQNQAAVADCMTADPSGGPATATTTQTINGINFTVFTSNDAGAGNIYQTTSYRTLHAGACYAVEYTVHSSELANYPASYNLKQYDSGMITSVLNRIVGTFTFL